MFEQELYTAWTQLPAIEKPAKESRKDFFF
jgi:hypothetical protein